MSRENDIPERTLEDARARIIDVIGSRITLKKTGKNWSALCPFHNEKTPSFSVSEDKELFHCFGGCGSGDAIQFVMRYDGLRFRDAVQSIVGNMPASGSPAVQQQPRAERFSYPSGHMVDPQKAADHLEQCKLVAQHIELLRENVAPCGDVHVLNGRLVAPLISPSGELVNLAAMANGSVYYSAGGVSFGATARIPARWNEDGRVILCQSYFDAWRLWWKLKGACEVRAAISADNWIWMTRKARSQFTHVGVHADDADEMGELGVEVVLL